MTRYVDRIGVAVGAGHLRAVGMSMGRIVWALEAPRTEDEALGPALERFLRSLPVQRWPRPAVRAVLEARLAQVKRLTGLPPSVGERLLTQLVQEGAPRFFLRNGHPLVTSGLDVAADGSRWCAAFDAGAVDALCDASSAAGFRLAGVAPSVAALPLVLEGERVGWEDDGVRVVIGLRGGRIDHVARGGVEGASSSPRPVLAPLAGRAVRFADACGAALLPLDAPFLHRPHRAARTPSRVPHWRAALAVSALLLGGGAALAARPLAAARAARDAEARLALMAGSRVEAARVAQDLDQVSGALSEVERFAAGRRSPTLLLADLARAFPSGSVLVMVRLDTTGVVATLLAPRAAQIVGAIERLPGAVAPEIVGPVTRETVAVPSAEGSATAAGERRVLERMTVSFRLESAGHATATTLAASGNAAWATEAHP